VNSKANVEKNDIVSKLLDSSNLPFTNNNP